MKEMTVDRSNQGRFSDMAFVDLREQYFVVMELGSHFIRADINVQDVNRIPSVLVSVDAFFLGGILVGLSCMCCTKGG